MFLFNSSFQKTTEQNENQDADGEDEQAGKKQSGRQKRGGRALLKPKKKEIGERFVKLARANRGKKKFVTGEIDWCKGSICNHCAISSCDGPFIVRN